MVKNTVAKFLATAPKSLKVGPHTWKIVVTDQMSASVPEGVLPNYGETEFRAQTIRIHPLHAEPAACVSSLIHELYHAGLFSFGKAHPKREEEGALTVETIFTTILRDNPTLIDWIKKGLI